MLHTDRLEQLNKQIVIGEKISILMNQSEQLIDIVNVNQKEVNKLKEESDQLQTHMDNATDLRESNDITGKGW
jgi:FtsZ-binding cell division protein ZapB